MFSSSNWYSCGTEITQVLGELVLKHSGKSSSTIITSLICKES